MNEEKQLATLVGLDLILSPEHYKEITKLQQENKQLKDFLGLLEVNIRINHDDIQINLYKKLLQIFKDLKEILGDKENE